MQDKLKNFDNININYFGNINLYYYKSNKFNTNHIDIYYKCHIYQFSFMNTTKLPHKFDDFCI